MCRELDTYSSVTDARNLCRPCEPSKKGKENLARMQKGLFPSHQGAPKAVRAAAKVLTSRAKSSSSVARAHPSPPREGGVGHCVFCAIPAIPMNLKCAHYLISGSISDTERVSPSPLQFQLGRPPVHTTVHSTAPCTSSSCCTEMGDRSVAAPLRRAIFRAQWAPQVGLPRRGVQYLPTRR